jgi:hypothetical protein
VFGLLLGHGSANQTQAYESKKKGHSFSHWITFF